MPALDHDLILKLDPDDHAAMLAARIAERDAAILAHDHERKRKRAEASKGAGHADTKKAEKDRDDTRAVAKGHEDALAAKVVDVKAKHAATDLIATDEGHDITAGTWVMKAEALLSGFGPIEVKRIPLTDQQCDEFVASYRVSARLTFEMPELQRQINEYLEAHPPVNGEPGHLIPEPEALLALRAALKVKQDTEAEERVKQGSIYAAVMEAAEEKDEDWTYKRMSPEGEIILGQNPHMTKYDVVL